MISDTLHLLMTLNYPTLNKEVKPIPERVSFPAFLTTTSDVVKKSISADTIKIYCSDKN